MATYKQPAFSAALYVEPAAGPEDAPPVAELGVSSAPLESMAFFFGQFCKPYADDFMLCRAESGGDPAKCLKEGRRVTRCGLDLVGKLKTHCDKEWEAHWQCLDWNNHTFYKCRKEERVFNDCVFKKLNLTKEIPETAEGQTPVHLKDKPRFK